MKENERVRFAAGKQVMGVIGDGDEQLFIMRDSNGLWSTERSKKIVAAPEQRLRNISAQGLGKNVDVHKIRPGECEFVNNEGGRNVDFVIDAVPEHTGRNKFMVVDVLKALAHATPCTFQTDRVQDSAYVAKIKCIDGENHLMVVTATERDSELPISAASNFRALAIDLAKTICEADLRTDRPVGYDSVLKSHANSLEHGPDPKTVLQTLAMIFGLRKVDAQYWNALASNDETSIEDIQVLMKTMAEEAQKHPDIAAYVRDRKQQFAQEIGDDIGASRQSKLQQAMENMRIPKDNEEVVNKKRRSNRDVLESYDAAVKNFGSRSGYDETDLKAVYGVIESYKRKRGIELSVDDAAAILKYTRGGTAI